MPPKRNRQKDAKNNAAAAAKPKDALQPPGKSDGQQHQHIADEVKDEAGGHELATAPALAKDDFPQVSSEPLDLAALDASIDQSPERRVSQPRRLSVRVDSVIRNFEANASSSSSSSSSSSAAVSASSSAGGAVADGSPAPAAAVSAELQQSLKGNVRNKRNSFLLASSVATLPPVLAEARGDEGEGEGVGSSVAPAAVPGDDSSDVIGVLSLSSPSASHPGAGAGPSSAPTPAGSGSGSRGTPTPKSPTFHRIAQGLVAERKKLFTELGQIPVRPDIQKYRPAGSHVIGTTLPTPAALARLSVSIDAAASAARKASGAGRGSVSLLPSLPTPTPTPTAATASASVSSGSSAASTSPPSAPPRAGPTGELLRQAAAAVTSDNIEYILARLHQTQRAHLHSAFIAHREQILRFFVEPGVLTRALLISDAPARSVADVVTLSTPTALPQLAPITKQTPVFIRAQCDLFHPSLFADCSEAATASSSSSFVASASDAVEPSSAPPTSTSGPTTTLASLEQLLLSAGGPTSTAVQLARLEARAAGLFHSMEQILVAVPLLARRYVVANMGEDAVSALADEAEREMERVGAREALVAAVVELVLEDVNESWTDYVPESSASASSSLTPTLSTLCQMQSRATFHHVRASRAIQQLTQTLLDARPSDAAGDQAGNGDGSAAERKSDGSSGRASVSASLRDVDELIAASLGPETAAKHLDALTVQHAERLSHSGESAGEPRSLSATVSALAHTLALMAVGPVVNAEVTAAHARLRQQRQRASSLDSGMQQQHLSLSTQQEDAPAHGAVVLDLPESVPVTPPLPPAGRVTSSATSGPTVGEQHVRALQAEFDAALLAAEEQSHAGWPLLVASATIDYGALSCGLEEAVQEALQEHLRAQVGRPATDIVRDILRIVYNEPELVVEVAHYPGSEQVVAGSVPPLSSAWALAGPGTGSSTSTGTLATEERVRPGVEVLLPFVYPPAVELALTATTAAAATKTSVGTVSLGSVPALVPEQAALVAASPSPSTPSSASAASLSSSTASLPLPTAAPLDLSRLDAAYFRALRLLERHGRDVSALPKSFPAPSLAASPASVPLAR